MCGRYSITSAPEAIRRLFATTNDLINFAPRYNFPPTAQGPVVRRHPDTGKRTLDLLRWGLVPVWAKDMSGAAKCINARGETVATLASFRSAFKKRRCLVPADSYFEWKALPDKSKQPYAIGYEEGADPMAFAGLWEGWKDPASGEGGEWIHTFSIITTEANPLTAPVHNRMPVILAPDHWPAWLGEVEASVEELQALLKPAPVEGMRVWPVDKRVGNVRNDDIELLKSITSQRK
ncbi:SOS response-associated peptidase [Nitrospirillum pindoramense]|uniref:Abasic site processing protein n=1 Tax=Nitrospirillum amazonense TaxID=28077 RepID=A0A560HIJ1_9PROT|nr:SOS response-associated peptidase [Nitrospirillum amazonense]TWB45821.1 putative SOS response-associated peptidase YedK [Nitrospirillum amazonense]